MIFQCVYLREILLILNKETGIVHVAPGHGADDYNLGIKNNVEVVQNR